MLPCKITVFVPNQPEMFLENLWDFEIPRNLKNRPTAMENSIAKESAYLDVENDEAGKSY